MYLTTTNNNNNKDAITTECRKISTKTLRSVKDSLISKIGVCFIAVGSQFEHLL